LAAEYSDAELIAACAKGAAWAWEALVERYKRLVYSVALRSGLGPEDGSDVFQTIFMQLLEHIDTIRDPNGIAAWLITSTKRLSWRVLRERRREPTESDGDTEDDDLLKEETRPGEVPDETLWMDRLLVQAALHQVTGGCQQLLRLLYFDETEPSYEEISARLKIPKGSIGPTRSRCLQKMREILRTMGMST
jgi:RNA polymerase sigma factor (sigma-70 family)